MSRYLRNSMAAICLIAAAAAVMLMPAPAAAQTLYGSLTGAVVDQQKAAMPGVTVTAINTGTGLSTEAVTDATGNYTIRNLAPGIYDVTAVLQGFRELRQRGLNITAGNIVRADLTLQLGQLSETVNVVAESTLLQTEKADLNTEIPGVGGDEPAAEPVPELSVAAEPGSRRDADAVPERRDRHAGPLAAHVGERHAAERQHDARGRRGVGQRLAAAPRDVRRVGRSRSTR